MAIGFKLLTDPDATVYRNLRIASQAYTVGDSLMFDRNADATDAVPATSSSVTTNMFAVAMETVTASATQVLCALITNRQQWVADASAAPSTNDNYQRMVLTDKATVNNTHTDATGPTAVFEQNGVVDTTNKRIVGRFLIGVVTA